jgi:GR25 family glycosyltransferase involved in LPS biosynthesis
MFAKKIQVASWIQHVDLFLYINLAHRKDRNLTMQSVLEGDLKIPHHKIHRIEAIKSQPGFTGCTRSHLKAVEYALDQKVDYVCLLEDDFDLLTDPKQFHHRVNQAWQTLNGQFDVLYLTMTPISLEKTEVAEFYRVKQALAMPALIVSARYLPKLKQIYTIALQEKIPHDLVTQRYQSTDHWYGFYPAMARQKPGFSDIEARHVDYKHLDVEGSMLKIE